MPRRITLDQLAAMVARGFEDVRREMHRGLAGVRQEMREGFAAVHETLADHSHRFDRIERKLDNTIERVDDHDVRVQALEKRRGPRS